MHLAPDCYGITFATFSTCDAVRFIEREASPTGELASYGHIIVVGGINDVLLVRNLWPLGFRWAGLPHRVRAFCWQQGWKATLTFADLWRVSHHHRCADHLAEEIRTIRTEDPDCPIHIVAHSAGTAITAYALERLEHETITSAAFVASGLSPDYDLSRAIRHCSAGLLSVHSRFDLLTLGIGTTLLGTVDRKRRPAAGMLGFRSPTDPEAQQRFVQMDWNIRYSRQGWIGGHISGSSPWFAKRTLAGWIRRMEGAIDVEVEKKWLAAPALASL